MALEKAEDFNVKYFEVSAKTGSNIKEAFNHAGEEYVKVNIQQNEMTFSKVVGVRETQKH